MLGVLWLLDAALQAQPHFFTYDWWHRDLPESVMGQPAAVSHSILWVTGLLSGHPVLANAIAVAVQAGIGGCLVVGRGERAAIAVSIPWALAVWWIGEGFGAVPTGFAQLAGGAPGPVLLYVLIGLLAWPRPGIPGCGERPVVWALAGSAWAALWVGGAVLEVPWRVPTGQALQANIEQDGLGEPSWLAHVSADTYSLVAAHPLAVPIALSVAQIAIGAAILFRPLRTSALAAGAGLAGLFWVTVQALGGLPTGGATDPGAGPLMVLLSACLMGRLADPAHFDPRLPGLGRLARALRAELLQEPAPVGHYFRRAA